MKHDETIIFIDEKVFCFNGVESYFLFLKTYMYYLSFIIP